MAYVPVPKDLSKIKTKVMFNLTKRQLVCFSIAAVIGIPTYIFTKESLGTSTASMLMVTAMLPFFFVAMYEKDGLTVEQMLYYFIRHKFLLPGVRPYQSENLYEKILEQIKIDEEVAYLERKARGEIPDKKEKKKK